MHFQLFIQIIPYLLVAFVSVAQPPPGYYTAAEGKSGTELKAALHNIIKGHTVVPYNSSSTDTWDILKLSDRDTANRNNVLLIYTGASVNAAQEYSGGSGWEREHIWAQSHGNFNTDMVVGSDLHNLKPIEGSINSSRGNKDFDNGGNRYKTTSCFSDADSWEPRDNDKGDVARILFYMAVRYEGEDGNPDLELIDAVNTDVMKVTGKGYHGRLSTLISWNKFDPVDSFEIRRNNTIYNCQKNRNPFIDHPEYADIIWATSGIRLPEKFDVKVYPIPAKEFIIIELPLYDRVRIDLFDMSGDLIMGQNLGGKTKISMTGIFPGTYFLRIVTDDSVIRKKVVVQ